MEKLVEQYYNEDSKKIFLLTDSENDYLLLYQFLKELEIPFQVSRIQSKEEYVNALKNNSPDLILFGLHHPSAGDSEALELRMRYCPDVPFLIVTSFLGEVRMVEILTSGATDFILKENLFSLNRRIMISLREAEERNRRTLAEIALRESEAKYRQLVEQAPDGIFVSDESLNFLEANTRASEMLGYTRDELLKMNVKDSIPSGTASPIADLQKLKTGEIRRYETLRKRKDDSVFSVEVSVSKTSNGYYQGIVRDISLRKKALHDLEEALNKLEFHLINSPLAVLEVDHALIITRWCGQAEKMFGWKQHEVLGKHIYELELSHPNDRENASAAFQKNLQEGLNHFVTQQKCYTKGGTIIYSESYNSVSFDEHGQLLSILCILNDVTVQKVEAKARREWRAQEHKRVAREIHEGIGQILVAAKFKAGSIDVTSPDAEKDINQIEGLLEMAIQEVRRISLDIAPRNVEEWGIENAIRNLCEQVKNETGIQVSFIYTAHANKAGNHILSTVYYVVQEALHNIIKHANASRVVVELSQNSKEIELMLRDNGRGFAVDLGNTDKTSGLRKIKKRVQLLGGSFQITSDSQTGTYLKSCLPVINTPPQL